MDEVELKRAFTNLRVLVDNIDNTEAGAVNIRNAMLTIMSILYALDQRMTGYEYALAEEDEGTEDE
jgi:hypothetical protein